MTKDITAILQKPIPSDLKNEPSGIPREFSLKASGGNGTFAIWPDDRGYRGHLHQWRETTDSFKNKSMEFALQKAIEWLNIIEG